MRFLTRFGLGLIGLALTSPLAVAQGPAPTGMGQPAPVVQAAGHQHKGLLGWRHCVECQRARAKSRDGVVVPPPPAAMPGAVIAQAAQGVVPGCPSCQLAPGEVLAGPVTIVDNYAPGRAVVGGNPVMASSSAPGHAVVGGSPFPGADPTPIGVAKASHPRWNGAPAAASMKPGLGAYDPSVMPTSMVPPQTALSGPSAGRPHILGHLFGVSGIGKGRREQRERHEKEQHAAISYDPPSGQVNELPASLVYGKGH